MTLVSLDSVSKTLGDAPLFRGASFSVDEGDRIGFVGPNGCGKSTLLKLLAGRMPCDDGSIARRRGLRAAFLDQVPSWDEGATIRDFLFAGDDPTTRLVARYEAALAALHADPASVAEAELAALTHDMEEKGGFDLERRFASVLSELGVGDLGLRMDALSGGMARKAALARCLAPSPDLVLLDEPTNHLDVATIEWLERRLAESGAAFVMVTHDRWFLDAVCSSILEIDGGEVRKYPGGYSDYLERRAAREEEAAGRERRRESILRVEMEWLKRGPKARGGKDKKRKERIRGMQDGRPEAAGPKAEGFGAGERRLGSKVLELEGVAKAWDGRTVVAPFDYKLTKGERIGIVGPNGSGKSTLLDMIAGRTEPDSGRVVRGETAAVGYFDQACAVADPAMGALDFVRSAAERVRMPDGAELSAEQFLERFGFPREAGSQSLGKLSGGELRRLVLARLLIASPNVLLLDEPTNDFDIPTIALLEDFLRGFGGCVVAASHDRALLEGLADTLWILDGRGGVRCFSGGYADWRDEESGREEAAAAQAAAQASAKPRAAARGGERSKQGLSFRENKEFEALMPEIEALEEEKSALEAFFADPAFAKDAAAFAAASVRYAELGPLIEAKTARWEELAERA